MAPQPSPAVAPLQERRARFLPWLALPFYLLHGALVWLLLLRPPNVMQDVQLDASWMQLVAFDLVHRVQAGVDFVFTYGPLGYFLPAYPTYYPELYWPRVWVEMGLKALVVACVVAPGFRMQRLWQRLAYLAVVLVVTPIASESFQLMSITAATLWLVTGRCRLVLVVPAVAFFAFLGLGKFTFFMLGSVCVGLIFANVWRRDGWRRAAVVPLAFAGAIAIAWIAAGQSLANLPAFYKGSSEIASGYNESMRWVPIDGKRNYFGDVLLALGSIGLTGLAALWVLLPRPWRLQTWLAAGALAATLFLTWKAGFVRQDVGHSAIFFSGAVAVPMWSWSIAGASRRSVPVIVLALLASATAFIGAFRVDSDFRPATVWPLLRHIALLRWDFVMDPAATQRRLDEAAERLARKNDLPQVRGVVGEAPVDEVPHHQNVLFLNRLNVRHRPVFQSYSAYTPYLQRLNADFYADPKRGPEFVLFKVDPTDGQFPTVADSQIYPTLLQHFRPRLVERDYLLLERVRDTARPVRSVEVQRQTVHLGEWVALTSGPGLGELAVDLDFSRFGSLSSFLIRGPRLYLDVRLDDGQEITGFVTSRGSMRLPFLVDPFVRHMRNFAKLYTATWNLPRVTAFRLRARDGQENLYAPEFRFTFSRRDPPVPLDEAAVQRLHVDYPMFDRSPRAIEPRSHFGIAKTGEVLVEISHADSAMTFDDLQGDIAVSGGFGIMDAAYEGAANTDGVTFRVERVGRDGSATALFERRLEPKDRSEDRGMQWFALEVGLESGDSLVFRTLTGPSAGWDWSYWTDLRFLDAGRSPRTLTADKDEIVRADGGSVRFDLDAGREFANRSYEIIGGNAGAVPGTTMDGVEVPLNLSSYSSLAAVFLALPMHKGARGRLDAEGRAVAVLNLPPNALAEFGPVIHHAFVVLDEGGRVLMASNPVPLRMR